MRIERPQTKRWLRLIEVETAVPFPGKVALLSGFDALSEDELAAAAAGELSVAVVCRCRNRAGRPGAWSEFGTEAKVSTLIRLPNGELGAKVEGVGLVALAGRPCRRRRGYEAEVVSVRSALRLLQRPASAAQV